VGHRHEPGGARRARARGGPARGLSGRTPPGAPPAPRRTFSRPCSRP
jgi:hypothetical protein